MVGRISAYLRNNLIGVLALVVALCAGAYAAGLPHNSVGSGQIKPGAVKGSDLAADSVTGGNVVDDSLTGRDVDEASLKLPTAQGAPGPVGATGPKGATGPAGATGPQGPSTGPAGGDLTGSYPNPTLRQSEPLHYVGAAGEPPFQNNWGNFGGFYAKAAFYKDRSGIVHLRGLVNGGTFAAGGTGVIFTMPSAYEPCGASPSYAPASNLVFGALSSNAAGRITLYDGASDLSTGAYVIAEAGSGWISLDGIDYRADGC